MKKIEIKKMLRMMSQILLNRLAKMKKSRKKCKIHQNHKVSLQTLIHKARAVLLLKVTEKRNLRIDRDDLDQGATRNRKRTARTRQKRFQKKIKDKGAKKTSISRRRKVSQMKDQRKTKSQRKKEIDL